MKKTQIWHAKAGYLAALLCLTACGTEPKKAEHTSDSQEKSASATSNAAASESFGNYDELVTPPKEYYSQLLFEDSQNVDAGLELGATVVPQTLFVNFDGVTLQKGFNKGQSFILCKAQATIPPTNLKPADREDILSRIAKHYERAGAKLLVTDKKPASGDFTMLVVGGSYSTLGCVGAGVLGIAPYDVGNKNRNDIGFAFTPNGVTNRIIAETVSHEAGHSFGLDHVVDKSDIMYFSSSPSVDKFGISKVSGGLKTQDAPQILVGVLGAYDGNNLPNGTQSPSTTPVDTSTATTTSTTTTPTPTPTPTPTAGGTATIPGSVAQIPGIDKLASILKLLPILQGGVDINTLLPLLQKLIPNAGAGTLPGLDKILQLQQLLAALQGKGGANAATLGTLPGLDLQSLMTLAQSLLGNQGGLAALKNLLNLAQGQNIQTIIQTLLKGGLGGILGNLGGLGGLLGGSNPIVAPSGAATSVPDLTQLLGIPKNMSSANLVDNFRASVSHVQSNYGGDEKDAILSLLKVAYAQAMKQAP